MDITDYILERTSRINTCPEVTLTPPGFSMFNSGGVEVEVGEFLYSLVRLIKPGFIVETGTHLGISSLYMALALSKNVKGSIWTYEVIPELQASAKELWKDLSISIFIRSILQPSLEAEVPPCPIDILFLDSEPQFRFDEFLKFWEHVIPGGLIIIHDLHPSLGHHGETYHGIYDWPYGDFRTKIGPFIKSHQVQTISLPTPRGITIFQKEAPGFEATSYIRE
jgi:predicted O-methyltransferase YrrM